jgi:hypothetical protein
MFVILPSPSNPILILPLLAVHVCDFTLTIKSNPDLQALQNKKNQTQIKLSSHQRR